MMTVSMLASSGALALPQLEFTILAAIILLLILRTWSGVNPELLTHAVSLMLTVAILALIAIFIFLVYVRFRTLA